MLLVGLVGYTLHATMYAYDPGFQIEESYTWVYNIFEYLTLFSVCLIIVILGLFMTRIWIFWPKLIVRHKVNFQFSVYFIFCFFVCKIF